MHSDCLALRRIKTCKAFAPHFEVEYIQFLFFHASKLNNVCSIGIEGWFLHIYQKKKTPFEKEKKMFS